MEERITFKKIDKEYYETLKEWWHSERVKQFWDNSEEMEEDVDSYVVNDGFFKGKKLHLMIRGREKKQDIYENPFTPTER